MKHSIYDHGGYNNNNYYSTTIDKYRVTLEIASDHGMVALVFNNEVKNPFKVLKPVSV